MDELLNMVHERFKVISDKDEWTDEDNREADFLLRVQITVRGQHYANQRLTYALTRLRDGVQSEDPEQIRKGMLWANHHLPRYGVPSANSNQSPRDNEPS